MNWQVLLDPAGAVLVLGGTLAAALLRCGVSDFGVGMAQLGASFGSRFDRDKARAKLARQVEAIRHDGVLCAAETETQDGELDSARATLLRHRSIPVLLAEHRRHRRIRLAKGERAVAVFDGAGDLAPVFGLAGTLFALSQMAARPDTSEPSAMMTSVALAVVTTLYGVVAAHLLFYPLARRIERRMLTEDAAREELVTWLAAQSASAMGQPAHYGEAA